MNEFTDTEIDMPLEEPIEYTDVEEPVMDTAEIEEDLPEEISEDIVEDIPEDVSSDPLDKNVESEEIKEDISEVEESTDSKEKLSENQDESEDINDAEEDKSAETTKETSEDQEESEDINDTENDKSDDTTKEELSENQDESEDINDTEDNESAETKRETSENQDKSEDINDTKNNELTDSKEEFSENQDESENIKDQEDDESNELKKEEEITENVNDINNEENNESNKNNVNDLNQDSDESDNDKTNIACGRGFSFQENNTEQKDETSITDFHKNLQTEVTDLAHETHQNLETTPVVTPMVNYDTTDDYHKRLEKGKSLNEGFQDYLHTGVQDQAKFLREETNQNQETPITLKEVERNLKSKFQDNWRDEFKNFIIPNKKPKETEEQMNERLKLEINNQEMKEESESDSIKKQRERLEKDFTKEEIEKNKEYAALYQEGKESLTDFFESEEVETYVNKEVTEELDKQLEYSTIALSSEKLKELYNDYNKDIPKDQRKEFNPNIAGFYNPRENRCYINLDLNTDPKEFKSTVVHENLHRLSKAGIMLGDQNCQLNEGITEYLCKKVLKSEYPEDNTIYRKNTERVEMLESIVGKDKIYEAYFNNKPEILSDIFEAHLGLGSWEEFNDYCETSVKLDNGEHFLANYKANTMLKELDIAKNLGSEYLAEFKKCNQYYSDLNTPADEKIRITKRLFEIEKLLEESKEMIV